MSLQSEQAGFIKQFDTGKTITKSLLVKQSLADEGMVRRWLEAHGFIVSQPLRRKTGDLVVNGKRVEVKSASPSQHTSLEGYSTLRWQFNIHHGGRLDESGVDFYIFRLSGVPGFKAAIHLVIPAPLERTTISMTLRSLIIHWGRYANNLDLLRTDRRDVEQVRESS